MTTVRELCRVLATALHVPGVDRIACDVGHQKIRRERDGLTNANKEMRGIVSEIRSVMRAPDLATLHELAKDMAHNSSYRLTINRLRHTKDWRDLGALKAELLDMTILERNKHAKAVVQDIEKQRKEAR